jgi:hypothetical protein
MQNVIALILLSVFMPFPGQIYGRYTMKKKSFLTQVTIFLTQAFTFSTQLKVRAEVDLRMEVPADEIIAVVQLRGRSGRGEGRDG